MGCVCLGGGGVGGHARVKGEEMGRSAREGSSFWLSGRKKQRRTSRGKAWKQESQSASMFKAQKLKAQ